MKSEFTKIYDNIVKTNIISQQRHDSSPIDKAVYEHDTLLLIKEFRSFSQPMWVNGLKNEIEEFKQECIKICKVININPSFFQHLNRDERYEWQWNDQWLFLLIPGMFIKASKNQVKSFLKSKNIPVEEAFQDMPSSNSIDDENPFDSL